MCWEDVISFFGGGWMHGILHQLEMGGGGWWLEHTCWDDCTILLCGGIGAIQQQIYRAGKDGYCIFSIPMWILLSQQYATTCKAE